MAARNPTSFTEWQNIAKIETGKSVLGSTVDDAISDQIFTLDEESLVASWRTPSPTNYNTTSASFAQFAASTSGSSWPLKTRDNCLASGNLSHEGAVQIYCSDGTTAGNVQFYNATIPSTSGSLAVPTSTTSPTWFGWATFDFPSAGAWDTIQIRAQRTAGSGTIYLAGWCIFAVES